MPDEAPPPNTVAPAVRGRSTAQGDVPEAMRRRYLLDGRGGPGVGFYVDAQVKVAAFRDQGRKLATARNDPNAIRDMVGIAQHRGWTIITVAGSASFRRETWLASRAAGLEVRGYQPTERDLQALDRRLEPQRRRAEEPKPTPAIDDPGVKATLRVVEAIVRSRIKDPEQQKGILRRAEARVSAWQDRGAQFANPEISIRSASRERNRAR